MNSFGQDVAQGTTTPSQPPKESQLVNFSEALTLLKHGQEVTRQGWNGKGMWIKMQVPDSGSKMTRPYLYMSCADGSFVPWVASQSDILASDWQLIS